MPDRLRMYPARPRLGVAVQLVLATILFAVAVYYLIHVARNVDFAQVVSTIAKARPAPLAAALACQVGFLLLQTLRWRWLLPKLKTIGLFRSLGLLAIGNMVNMLLPLRSGDLARPFLAMRCAGAAFGRAAAAAIAERALDIGVLGALAVAVPLQLDLSIIYVTTVVVGVALILAYLLRRYAYSVAGANGVVDEASGLFALGERAWRATLNAFAEISDARAIFLAAAATVLSFVLALGTYFFALAAIDLTVTPRALLSLFVVTQLGSAIPNAPASIGVFDALAVALLVSLGVSHLDALSGTFLLHVVLVAVPVGFGIAATLREGWSILREAGRPGAGALPGERRS